MQVTPSSELRALTDALKRIGPVVDGAAARMYSARIQGRPANRTDEALMDAWLEAATLTASLSCQERQSELKALGARLDAIVEAMGQENRSVRRNSL